MKEKMDLKGVDTDTLVVRFGNEVQRYWELSNALTLSQSYKTKNRKDLNQIEIYTAIGVEILSRSGEEPLKLLRLLDDPRAGVRLEAAYLAEALALDRAIATYTELTRLPPSPDGIPNPIAARASGSLRSIQKKQGIVEPVPPPPPDPAEALRMLPTEELVTRYADEVQREYDIMKGVVPGGTEELWEQSQLTSLIARVILSRPEEEKRKLLRLLDDPRPAVRLRAAGAVNGFAFEQAMATLEGLLTVRGYDVWAQHGIWALDPPPEPKAVLPELQG